MPSPALLCAGWVGRGWVIKWRTRGIQAEPIRLTSAGTWLSHLASLLFQAAAVLFCLQFPHIVFFFLPLSWPSMSLLPRELSNTFSSVKAQCGEPLPRSFPDHLQCGLGPALPCPPNCLLPVLVLKMIFLNVPVSPLFCGLLGRAIIY